MKSFLIQLDQIQPSQLYISQAKLALINHNYSMGNDQALPPVPIKELNGRLIYTDGHTRALAALINGRATISAVWDVDALDWEAYQICVSWCLEEGIRTIADLRSRIVNPAEYQSLWLDRCQQMQTALAQRLRNII